MGIYLRSDKAAAFSVGNLFGLRTSSSLSYARDLFGVCAELLVVGYKKQPLRRSPGPSLTKLPRRILHGLRTDNLHCRQSLIALRWTEEIKSGN
jgi:hypothetical protein